MYHGKVDSSQEVPGQGTKARREASAPPGALKCTINRDKYVVFSSWFRNGCRKLRNQPSGTPPHWYSEA